MMSESNVLITSYPRLVAGILCTTVGIIWALIPSDVFPLVDGALSWLVTVVLLAVGLLLVISSRTKAPEKSAYSESI